MPEKPTREERLAQALRDNLRRRKAQARAEGQDGPANAGSAPGSETEEPAR